MPAKLTRQYDWVFTSYGVLGWLPDLEPWGRVIERALKPGGRLLVVEFHPALWMLDDDFKRIEYSYFKREPIVETQTSSYAGPESDVELRSCQWNYSLAEIFSSLHAQGLQVVHFDEYDYSPWDCFPSSVAHPRGFQLEGLAGIVPMLFSLEAFKPPG